MPKILLAAIAIAAFSLMLLQPNSVSAHTWEVDDGCDDGLSADEYFWAGGPPGYWFDDTSGGVGDCFMMTPNKENPPYSNIAEWYLPVDSVSPQPIFYDHWYHVYVYIVDNWVCEYPAVGWAHYHRWQFNHAQGSPSSPHVWWDQDDTDCTTEEVTQGYFCTSDGAFWDMQDYTLHDDDSYFIIVDQVGFYPLGSDEGECE